MPAIEPLYELASIKSSDLSNEECLFLEADLFRGICEELKEIFRAELSNYFFIMKFNIKMEDAMIESEFIRLIISDIISTEEYTLDGIALYTDTHLDVVEEIFLGKNKNPSALFLRRLIELHRKIRHVFYLSIIKKILSKHSST